MQVRAKDIAKVISAKEVFGDDNRPVTGLSFDTRKIKPGQVFFAIKGNQTDGHTYIEQAVRAGAAAVVLQDKVNQTYKDITYIYADSTSTALGKAADFWYDKPSRKLNLIGITGTNGKTTTVTLLHRLFIKLGHKAGLISTVANYINQKDTPAARTTPDALTTNALLARMAEQGCDYCFMEVSSHAVVQNRIAGLHFSGGIFTNITHDHLDYHGSFSEYLKAKKCFFDALPQSAFAITNTDDKNGKIVLQNTAAKKITYGLKNFADYKCKIQETHIGAMLLLLNGTELWTVLTGNFNAYNITAVYAAAMSLNQKREEVLIHISSLKPVRGRFEVINKNGKTAVIDYAHTPDALKNVLQTLNKIRKPEQKLITLIGAGGDRDKTKRPLMAKVATEKSDKVVLSSDNPRTEDPLQILNEMEAGIEKGKQADVLKIPEREAGIKTALMLAGKNDIVLIAGKGHETYQEINGIRKHFDDKEIAEKYM